MAHEERLVQFVELVERHVRLRGELLRAPRRQLLSCGRAASGRAHRALDWCFW